MSYCDDRRRRVLQRGHQVRRAHTQEAVATQNEPLLGVGIPDVPIHGPEYSKPQVESRLLGLVVAVPQERPVADLVRGRACCSRAELALASHLLFSSSSSKTPFRSYRISSVRTMEDRLDGGDIDDRAVVALASEDRH
jgi:hypothetical protein